jgi:hypothetical protein
LMWQRQCATLLYCAGCHALREVAGPAPPKRSAKPIPVRILKTVGSSQDIEDGRFEAVLRLPFAHCGLVGHVGRGTGRYAGRCLGRLLIDLDLGDDLGRPKMMGERDEAARDQAAKPVYSAHTARFHVLTNPAQDATGTGIGE